MVIWIIHWHRKWTCAAHFRKIDTEEDRKSIIRYHPVRQTSKPTTNNLIKKRVKINTFVEQVLYMNLIPSEPGPPACIVVRVLATRHKGRVRIPIQASVFVVVFNAPVEKTTIAPIINQPINQPTFGTRFS